MQTGSRTLGGRWDAPASGHAGAGARIDQAVQFCQALKDREVRLDSLGRGGTAPGDGADGAGGGPFLDRQQGDTRRTLLTVFLMGGLIALMLWGFSIDAEDAPPLPLLVVLVAIPGVVILGVLLAMIQRFREIEKGGRRMRSNTDRKPSRLAPVLAALGTILVVFILVGTMLWAFLSAGGADTIAVGVMALYGVVGLAVVGGVLAALIQRLREIKRGEEEDAKKY